MLIFYNAGFFQQTEYGEHSVEEKTVFKMAAVRSEPNFVGASIDRYELKDETTILQLGSIEEKDFTMMQFDDAAYTGDRKWPTKEEPHLFYKYSSWWIE